MDTHLCSSAIERSLHLGLSVSNALTHRPFSRCMYTYIRLLRLYRARARARVCLWRRAACVQTTKICQHSDESAI
jgi:hypothetical protein